MNFKSIFTNELPFMIHLPNGEYKVKIIINNSEKTININLSDRHFRLYTNPFPEREFSFNNFYEGEAEDLKRVVIQQKLPNYAFQPLKSYISFVAEEEKEFTQQEFDEVDKERMIERLKALIPSNRDINPANLPQIAEDHYNKMNQDQLTELKTNYLINHYINKLTTENIYFYHAALNIFIKQYAYVRQDFFVEPLTVHTLEGTWIREYVNGQYYNVIRFAGKAPTVLLYQKWMPEIGTADLETLNDRLLNNIKIPPTNSLILVARNLSERGEFRSAVIESSAALEIAVEEKITDVLISQGKSNVEIDVFLEKTKTNFNQRCDWQLKQCTGRSFVNDNPTLWDKIDNHRKIYRHKIAHSTVMPDEKTTAEIITDFESAIKYIQTL
jgi:hypothetical protein